MSGTVYIDRPAAYAVITNADGLLAVVQGLFRAELTNKLASTPEHELIWILPNEAASRFFHECHAWAVDRAVTC